MWNTNVFVVCAHSEKAIHITSFPIFFITNLSILFLERVKAKVLVTQSCLTLCDAMDCSLLGSSIHGIFQARIMEWIAISFFRSPSLHRDRIYVSCVCLLHWQANSLLTGGNWEASLTFYPPIIVLSFQTNISVLLGVYMRSKVV